MKKRTWLNRIIYFLLIVGIVVLGILFFVKNQEKTASINPPNPLSQGGTIQENLAKKSVETISFENWQPGNYRKILGTVKSSSDIDIYSNLSGNIAKVFVDIGDKVYRGEVLAKFSRENDLSQISYENALNSLENTKISAENSVKSAEIALQNAQNDLTQTIQSTKQNHSQTYAILYSQARNMDTIISNSLSWADRLMGVTKTYDQDPRGGKVGQNNSILKNDTKNLIRELSREFQNSRDLETYEQSELQVLQFANNKMQFLKKIQTIIRNMDKLIRGTTTSQSFLEITKTQLQAEAQGIVAKIDGNIVSLESQIEASKSSNEQINTTILAAENGVRNAESSLNLAKSSAENQISGAENQKRLTQKSINDLNVRAPFAGKISAKFINDFDRVNPGQKLFSIVSESSVPEIIAHLTAEETRLLSDIEKIKIELGSDEIINVKNIAISGKFNSASQKMEVKFSADEKFRGNLIIGSIANILLPISSENSNLIPISAISFEPDGAEVFILNKIPLLAGEGGGEVVFKIERRKVQTGKIISNSIEILSGLESRRAPQGGGEILVKYRNRVNAGDLVEIKN